MTKTVLEKVEKGMENQVGDDMEAGISVDCNFAGPISLA